MADSKNIDDGGLAFPGTRFEELGADGFGPLTAEAQHFGLSKREWFAGQALAGIMSGLCANSEAGDRAYDRVSFSHAAQDAYMVADAMLKAGKAGGRS